MAIAALEHERYLIRRQVLKLFGGAFRIYDPSGQLVLFANQKGFRLREDIRLYTDEAMGTEALLIKARSIVDFSSAYDVVDSASGEKIGALKRRGWKSLVKDEWIFMDAEDREIGFIREDHFLLALLRRLVTNLVPQKYEAEIDGSPACVYKQHFNPFVMKLDVDFSMDYTRSLDKRLGLAAGVLLCAIEGRQR